MKVLEKGTKLIKTVEWSSKVQRIDIMTIAKVNKKTYTLENKTLLYIEDLRERKEYAPFSLTRTKYQIYTKEKWNELELEMEENNYKYFKKSLKKSEFKNIDFMKRFIKEEDELPTTI